MKYLEFFTEGTILNLVMMRSKILQLGFLKTNHVGSKRLNNLFTNVFGKPYKRVFNLFEVVQYLLKCQKSYKLVFFQNCRYQRGVEIAQINATLNYGYPNQACVIYTTLPCLSRQSKNYKT